ncbi:hypothetical protein L2E82_36513 [Cichorium intybus]|uniref:Uncharacterized protein n=1 Tax=Cichorium intybus TaxID=13427 RepID=A0ACB9BRP6_CICIN|nr:hypothetical protein L2E82_36513 [Cichorium intybus]
MDNSNFGIDFLVLTIPSAVEDSSMPVIAADGACKEVMNMRQVPQSVGRKWTWRSEGDLLLNGAYFHRITVTPATGTSSHLLRLVCGLQQNLPARRESKVRCDPSVNTRDVKTMAAHRQHSNLISVNKFSQADGAIGEFLRH